jgi:hypothetical protein
MEMIPNVTKGLKYQTAYDKPISLKLHAKYSNKSQTIIKMFKYETKENNLMGDRTTITKVCSRRPRQQAVD